MAQWHNQKLVSQRYRVLLQVVLDFLVFINNLINIKYKHKKTNVIICILMSGASQSNYNMYNSMTSSGVHLYPLFYCIQYIRGFNKYILLVVL